MLIWLKKTEHYKKKIIFIYKNGKEILTSGNFEIEQNKFYRPITPIFGGGIHIENVLVSNKTSFDEKNFKYFIGHLNNGNKVKSLNIMLPKTTTFVKGYHRQTKWMYCLIKDNNLLEKHNTIWDKVSADMRKKNDGEPVYNKNYLKTNIKSHGNEVKNFFDKKFIT